MVTLGAQVVGEWYAEVWQSDVNQRWYVTFGMVNVCRDSVFVGDQGQAIGFAVRYLSGRR